ncbi:peptide transporter [Lentzea sp. NBRC 105346]|uniref:peptide MFS transporter n=1 Tax=Lentzea sp. NBRC 105346 TaxID=3032205 RepID=UPI00249F9D36|nr:oligopeptide:H+ symporter [Lentzea sp. NBRC 105346]GLZ32175.1 peptide transporter [Lentzea sp. NBRC 105346]
MTATLPAKATALPIRNRWYVTLFMSDLWERFGFYGMQAILVLYAAAPTTDGGLGLPAADAAALFGAWMGLTFMLSLPGGWLADRVLGTRPALQIGGALITLGYVGLALPVTFTTPVGLLLVSAGTGLFKPNHQALLTMLLGARKHREAGISLIYVGIQLSALTAPLITGYLGERVNWHAGFAAAAVAMAIGITQLSLSTKQFGDAGRVAARPLTDRTVLARWGTIGAVAITGVIATSVINPRITIILVGLCTLVAPIFGYRALRRHPDLTVEHGQRLRTFLAIFLCWTLFWLMIAQDGSVLTLFARDHVDRELFGATIPTSWLQSATPLFILVLAPVFAYFLARNSASVPGKLALGLVLAGGSFLIMAIGVNDEKTSIFWLLAVYLMHACGELIVAAVGIAAAAQVLPKSFISQMMGLLWLFAALGGGLGSQLARLSDKLPPSAYFLGLGAIGVGVAALTWTRRHAVASGLE